MLSLLKIEWLKLKKYAAFWWMLGIVALTYPGVNMLFHAIYDGITGKGQKGGEIFKQLLGNPFSFPYAWQSVGYFSSIFVMVPAILVIMIISNEYTYKTNRQNVIDGWSRSEFVLSKLLDVFIISLVVTLTFTIVASIFGMLYSTDISQARWHEQLKYIPLFLLQTFAQLTIAFLLGFIIRRSFIALGIFLFYFVIVEPIAVQYIRKNTSFPAVADFFPLEISDQIIPPPAFFGKFGNEGDYEKALAQINIHVVYTCLLTAGIWWLCFSIYNKKDI